MNQGMLSFDETMLERRSLARNEYLFRQGDKVRAIYFIEDGRLRLDRRTFDGRSLVFGTSSAGEFFVEACLNALLFLRLMAHQPNRSYPGEPLARAREASCGRFRGRRLGRQPKTGVVLRVSWICRDYRHAAH
jgi:hypothetical protein